MTCRPPAALLLPFARDVRGSWLASSKVHLLAPTWGGLWHFYCNNEPELAGVCIVGDAVLPGREPVFGKDFL